MENSRKLIRNAQAVVTCDRADQVFWDTDILVEGPEIRAIGKNLSAEGAEIIDGRHKFVYPGLINTHHHFFQTFVRNLKTIDYPNLTVMEWLYRVYPIFDTVDNNVIYYGALTALGDLVKHGCTTAFDHHYLFNQKTGKESSDFEYQAAQEMGVRFVLGRSCNSLPNTEGSSIPDGIREDTDVFLKDCERLYSQYHDAGRYSMRQLVVAPCQPMNSYQETFTESLAFARSHKLRVHTHLGEGENEIMKARYGKRSVAWCEDVGFIGPDIWIAHGWELQPYEFKVLGEAKMGVSHCPGPAILGGFPIIDVKSMQEAGIIVSLGCDGSATNDSSSMLDSMRTAYMMQAYNSKSRGGCMLPYEMLKIATMGGAETLGRGDELGSLEPGKAADLFMVDTGVIELTATLHDPRNLLARVGVTGPAWLTMVNGRVVWREGQLLTMDERAIAAAGEAACTKSLREPCWAFHDLV